MDWETLPSIQVQKWILSIRRVEGGSKILFHSLPPSVESVESYFWNVTKGVVALWIVQSLKQKKWGACYHWMLHCSHFIASVTPLFGKILRRRVVTFVHHEQCEGHARKARTFFIPSLARWSRSLRILSLTIELITQFLMSASNYYNTLERKRREKHNSVNSLVPKMIYQLCYLLLSTAPRSLSAWMFLADDKFWGLNKSRFIRWTLQRICSIFHLGLHCKLPTAEKSYLNNIPARPLRSFSFFSLALFFFVPCLTIKCDKMLNIWLASTKHEKYSTTSRADSSSERVSHLFNCWEIKS